MTVTHRLKYNDAEVVTMATEDHTATATHRLEDAPDPTELSAPESMALMRASGGYAILHYDTGRNDIQYRWNPATGAYEQICVITLADSHRVDSYFELTNDTTQQLLTSPTGFELDYPDIRAYAGSWFEDVETFPDRLDL